MANEEGQHFDELQVRLQDLAKRLELWRRMKFASFNFMLTPSGMFPGPMPPHPTSSRTTEGAQSLPASPGGMWPAGLHTLMCWPPFPPFLPPVQACPFPCPSTSQTDDQTTDDVNVNQADVSWEETAIEEMQGGNGEDEVRLYNAEDDTLFAEFDLQLESTDSWDSLNR